MSQDDSAAGTAQDSTDEQPIDAAYSNDGKVEKVRISMPNGQTVIAFRTANTRLTVTAPGADLEVFDVNAGEQE